MMWGIALMDFDPTNSISAICEHYTGSTVSKSKNDNKSNGNNNEGTEDGNADDEFIVYDLMDGEVDVATLAWLAVASVHAKDKMKQAEAYSLAFRLVTRLLDKEATDEEYNRLTTNGDDDDDDGFALHDYIAMRAMNSIQVHSHKAAAGTSSEQDFEAEALVAMTKALVSRWENITDTSTGDADGNYDNDDGNNSKDKEEEEKEGGELSSLPLWR